MHIAQHQGVFIWAVNKDKCLKWSTEAEQKRVSKWAGADTWQEELDSSCRILLHHRHTWPKVFVRTQAHVANREENSGFEFFLSI